MKIPLPPLFKSIGTEELINSASHFVMVLVSIAGLVVLIVAGYQHEQEWALFSAIIYGLSLIILYASSTAYHAVVKSSIKNKLRIMDHASIYLLIAGTYTPVLLLTIGGISGWIFFFIQWAIAIAGIILKIFFTGRYEKISLALYTAMGWMIVVKISYLYEALPLTGFWLMVSGGITYTLGIIFYVLDQKIVFSHFIWHLFVISGSVLHYSMISLYVL